MTLPLPLELTEPVLLAGDLNSQFRESASDSYDAKVQMCSRTSSRGTCHTVSALGLVQVDLSDVVVDDVIA